MIKPFLEVTEKEFGTILDEAVKNNREWDEIEKAYPQPEWCDYPHATAGVMGCWSLMDFRVKNEQYCVTCDCYISRLLRGIK